MKKTLKIASLMLVLVMTVVVLASCGSRLSGTYALGDTTYEFVGDSYTYKTPGLFGGTTIVEGTYEIDKEASTITLTPDDGEAQTYDFATGEENGVDYIKIGILKYTKQK